LLYSQSANKKVTKRSLLAQPSSALFKDHASEDCTTADDLEASGLDVRFYKKPSRWKKGTSEIKCMEVNGQASSFAVNVQGRS
jgi:hypothetical protein